ncbi:MAG: hypothetical protein LBP72_10195 [Dysgonamonadaceae bacterium]|jgi:hypothetical protein|nr:hypothetical protein [Dysgonamonadaceae bacterium]
MKKKNVYSVVDFQKSNAIEMKRVISIILFSLIVFSCEENDNLRPEPVNRTIIVYMAADNDLAADALSDMEEMKQSFSENGVSLIVFADLSDEAPYLLQIGQDKETFIKSYPELNSADANTLKEVIQEIVDMYPALEYGLILWSHGTSWMPSGSGLRSFVKDSGKEMNITDLAESLPVKFDFILFDACLMGSVEVIYELKDKANFIIASSTETIYTGFPYDEIIPELLKLQIDFHAVVQHYFDYYNSLQGAYRSATVSVVETKHLPELATQLKLLFENNAFDRETFNRAAVQRLDVYEEQYCFDLLDFVDEALPNVNKKDFIAQLERAVVYKNHTPQFLQLYDINTYCGLSSYIPHPQRNDLNNYYKGLEWYADSGINYLF